MQDYSQQATATSSSLSQQEFLNRVQKLRDEIKGLTNDVDYIGQLHQRTLSSTDGSANHDLEQYVSQTQIRNTAIKDGIKGLERDLAKTNDSSRTTKNTQLQSLKTFFKSELDKYQSIERDYQQRYRDQIARQYRIVNPDASEQEVQEAANADWGNEGVFQTAVSNSPRRQLAAFSGIMANEQSSYEQIVLGMPAPYSVMFAPATVSFSALSRLFPSLPFSTRSSPPLSSSKSQLSRPLKPMRSTPSITWRRATSKLRWPRSTPPTAASSSGGVPSSSCSSSSLLLWASVLVSL
jgi:hypothetical protein